MYFSIIVILLLLGVFGIIWYLAHDKGVNIYYVYSGPYSGKLRMNYSVKDPPLCFYDRKGDTREIEPQHIKNPRFALFKLQETNEVVLVDFGEKYPPEKGEYVIIRNGYNYYLRKIEVAYDRYDNEEEYKYQIQEGQVITYPEIVGNINYKEVI